MSVKSNATASFKSSTALDAANNSLTTTKTPFNNTLSTSVVGDTVNV